MTRTGNSITLCTIPITEAEHTIGQFGWIDGIGEGSFVKALKLLLVETLQDRKSLTYKCVQNEVESSKGKYLVSIIYSSGNTVPL